MNTFVMLTQVTPGAIASPRALEDLERRVMERVRTDCPEVEWVGSWAILGPFDYVDVFKAPTIDAAMKVAVIVRTFGYARTEVLAATDWRHFKDLVRHLPSVVT